MTLTMNDDNIALRTNTTSSKSNSLLEDEPTISSVCGKIKSGSNGGGSITNSIGNSIRNGLKLISNSKSGSSPSFKSKQPSTEFSTDSFASDGGIRGILKRSSREFYLDENSDYSSKEKKSVKFVSSRTMEKVHKVPSHLPYADEIWWSPQDINAQKVRQSDFTSATDEVKAIAKQYLSAFRRGHNEIREANKTKPQHEGADDSIATAPPRISLDLYNNLLNGRSHGFAGLELYAKASSGKRENIKIIISSVIKAQQSYKTQKSTGSLEDELYRIAKSLTRADRSWAFILAQADHEGVDVTPLP